MEQQYVEILREELIPAQGCTEPIALAYCAAKARELLGQEPEHIRVQASGNIIKNVKSVVVPGTDGRKGIEAAAVFGAIAGNAERKLEVLSSMRPENRARAVQFLERPEACTVEHLKTEAKLHIIVEMEADADSAVVELRDWHTNIVRMEKNGVALEAGGAGNEHAVDSGTDRSCLNVRDILHFAETVELSRVEALIDRQICYNRDISREGLARPYGSSIGKMLMDVCEDSIWTQVKAAAAAGSDARMGGSVLPVVINSGSGNQGITVSLPVIVYAEHIGASKERLIRALVISNLVAIHQKTKVGRLSAYCGAVSAAAGSGAGIAWLDGAEMPVVEMTISNTLANVSGIICDGAKPSCAAKIASAVEAALMGYELAKKGLSFLPGDGVVKSTLEETISGVGEIASEGMVQTDEKIIQVMISC